MSRPPIYKLSGAPLRGFIFGSFGITNTSPWNERKDETTLVKRLRENADWTEEETGATFKPPITRERVRQYETPTEEDGRKEMVPVHILAMAKVLRRRLDYMVKQHWLKKDSLSVNWEKVHQIAAASQLLGTCALVDSLTDDQWPQDVERYNSSYIRFFERNPTLPNKAHHAGLHNGNLEPKMPAESMTTADEVLEARNRMAFDEQEPRSIPDILSLTKTLCALHGCANEEELIVKAKKAAETTPLRYDFSIQSKKEIGQVLGVILMRLKLTPPEVADSSGIASQTSIRRFINNGTSMDSRIMQLPAAVEKAYRTVYDSPLPVELQWKSVEQYQAEGYPPDEAAYRCVYEFMEKCVAFFSMHQLPDPEELKRAHAERVREQLGNFSDRFRGPTSAGGGFRAH